MKKIVPFLLLSLLVFSCIPKEQIELRDIKNLSVERGAGEDPVLVGEAVFYNPNATRMKLREVKVDVNIDGKKMAEVDHKLKTIARGRSEFSVPIRVQLRLQDIGLVDALKSLFGGKKYEVHYKGHLKVTVNGFPLRVPIDHKEEFKLKF